MQQCVRCQKPADFFVRNIHDQSKFYVCGDHLSFKDDDVGDVTQLAHDLYHDEQMIRRRDEQQG